MNARQRVDTIVALELTKAAFARIASCRRQAWQTYSTLNPRLSILHRSAAMLAVECSELREAERLIGRALAGYPPDDIA